MNVQPVGNTNKLRSYYNYSKYAGYCALGSGALCLVQGVRHKKSHKALGLVSILLASLHVGLIKYLHSKHV